MDVNPQSITLISATMAMVASIASPFVSTRVASLQFKTNVLSVNWQKWIETLRDLVFSLNSQLLAAAVRQFIEDPASLLIAPDPKLFRRVKDLLRTMAKIELMLNPLEREHQQLNAVMKQGINQLRPPSLGHDIGGASSMSAATSSRSLKEPGVEQTWG